MEIRIIETDEINPAYTKLNSNIVDIERRLFQTQNITGVKNLGIDFHEYALLEVSSGISHNIKCSHNSVKLC